MTVKWQDSETVVNINKVPSRFQVGAESETITVPKRDAHHGIKSGKDIWSEAEDENVAQLTYS